MLSQLVTYVGWDNFRLGIKEYFAKHEWSNATLADLLTELEATSGKDLKAWSRKWLEEAGMTWLRPEIHRDDSGAISFLRIVQQHFNADATPRPQRMAVCAYNLEQRDGKTVFVPGHREEFDLEADEYILSSFSGLRPDVVLVNDADMAYGKVRLDDQSLHTACKHIDAFTDSLTRSQILSILWDMVRDGEVGASHYVDTALQALMVETHPMVVSVTLRNLDPCIDSYLAVENREAVARTVSSRLRMLSRLAKADSDTQLQLVRAAARRAHNPEDIAASAALLEGSETLAGLRIDTELRWNLLTSLAAVGNVDRPAIEAELNNDNTVNGRERVLQATASLPDAAIKAEFFDRAYSDTTLTNDQLGSVIAGFNRCKDPLLLAPFAQRYFDMLCETYETCTHEIGEKLITGMYPSALIGYESNGVDVLALTEEWLSNHTDAPAALLRMMRENQSDAKRIATAQQRDREG